MNTAQSPDTTLAWKELEKLAKAHFAHPADIGKSSSVLQASCGPIFLDYSKNLMNQAVFDRLIELANEQGLKKAIDGLFKGAHVNVTEDRPALHMACRHVDAKALNFPQLEVYQDIEQEREKMLNWVEEIHRGQWLTHANHKIEKVINLGIGGSDLGPKMAVNALGHFHQGSLEFEFVSNICPSHLSTVLQRSDPAKTLLVISSKSFTTQETLTNARMAMKWLEESQGKEALFKQVVAVCASKEKAVEFGIDERRCLKIWPWVGGRYSIWSSVGFPLALAIGAKGFLDFLKGAQSIDAHFYHTPLEDNVPVLLALIGIWYTNFLNAKTHAILPYDYNLRFFPDYLQQLDMESNGKQVQNNHQQAKYSTGPIIWGSMGTNGQHAFHQLLHQGAHFMGVDFLVACKSPTQNQTQQNQLIAHCLAQSEVLIKGFSNSPLPHTHLMGSRPSNTLIYEQLDPYTLGALIALYEHKVFVQGVIWNINSFDQPGVELGKHISKSLFKSLNDNVDNSALELTTRALLDKIIQIQKG